MGTDLYFPGSSIYYHSYPTPIFHSLPDPDSDQDHDIIYICYNEYSFIS